MEKLSEKSSYVILIGIIILVLSVVFVKYLMEEPDFSIMLNHCEVNNATNETSCEWMGTNGLKINGELFYTPQLTTKLLKENCEWYHTTYFCGDKYQVLIG